MYTITKGELWIIRQALEQGDSEDVTDAHGIVEAILEKGVIIEVTKEQMYQGLDEQEDNLGC